MSSPPVSPKAPLLKLDPSEYLTFRAPFNERKVCCLKLINFSHKRIGFKMRCTAAEYYAANPASGIIEPNDTYIISVYLWEPRQDKDLTKLDWRRHRFGVTYLVVNADCRTEQIDDIIRSSPKQNLTTAYLKSLILGQNDPIPQNENQEPLFHSRGRFATFGNFDSSPNERAVRERVKEFERLSLSSPSATQQNLEERDIEKEKLEGEIQLLRNQLELQFKENSRLQSENETIKNELSTLQEINKQLSVEKESAQLFIEEMKKSQEKEMLLTDISFWEVSYKDILMLKEKELGRGAFGTVYEGYFREQKVAVKMLHPGIISDHYVRLLRREVILMAKVRHPNLLLFVGVAFDHPSHCPLIITELMKTSLRNAYNKSMLVIKDKIRIMNNVASALNYLHSQNEPILHRDVSSANVLLEEVRDSWRAKLSDFGAANLARYSISAAPGAEIYTAPEIPRESVIYAGQRNREQTSKVDVFSYGVLLCEIFASTPRLPTATEFPLMLDSVRTKFPKMYQLIVLCVAKEPENRPTMRNIIVDFRQTFSQVL